MKYFFNLLIAILLCASAYAASPAADTLDTGNLKAQILLEPGKAGGTSRMYPFGPYSYAPAPEGYRPVYISHYGRHGARYTTKASKYDSVAAMLEKGKEKGVLTDLGRQLYQSYMPVYPLLKGHEGDLTLKGQEQHRELARRMLTAYPGVFEGGHVDARASNSPRAIISMMAFCSELEKGVPDLRTDFASDASDSPFTVLQTGGFPTFEQLFGLARTPEFGIAYTSAVESSGFDAEKYLHKLFSDIAPLKECGKPGDLVSALFDVYTTAGCLDYDIPFPELYTQEELFQQWELSNLYGVIMFKNNPYTRGVIPAYAWPLLDNILLRADEDLSSGDVKVRLRFGHDTIVGPILGLLGVGGWGEDIGPDMKLWKYRFQSWNIPMASNLQFIFYRNDAGNTLVRLMYNEQDQILPLKDQSLAPYYKWEDFKAHYSKVCSEARETLKRIEADVKAKQEAQAPVPETPGKISFAPNPSMPLPEGVHMYYNDKIDYDGRFRDFAPFWLIYPDGACNREEAEKLVDRLGLNGPLKDYPSCRRASAIWRAPNSRASSWTSTAPVPVSATSIPSRATSASTRPSSIWPAAGSPT